MLESLTHMEYGKGKCVKMEKSHEEVWKLDVGDDKLHARAEPYNIDIEPYRACPSCHNEFWWRTHTRYNFAITLHHGLTDKYGFITVIVANSQTVVSKSPCYILIVWWRNQDFVLLHSKYVLVRVQNLTNRSLQLCKWKNPNNVGTAAQLCKPKGKR